MFTPEEAKIIQQESKKLSKGYTIRLNRGMKLISCYIKETVLEEIYKMVKEGRFDHRSDAIRTMLDEYIDNRKVKNTE